VADLAQVTAEGDIAAVREHAHSLKGTALLVSAEALSDTASRLEQAGKAGDLAVCRELMPQVEIEFQRLCAVLEPE
jgi:HPt (histidine-containing phosphotransfer) domain-containing protein